MSNKNLKKMNQNNVIIQSSKPTIQVKYEYLKNEYELIISIPNCKISSFKSLWHSQ